MGGGKGVKSDKSIKIADLWEWVEGSFIELEKDQQDSKGDLASLLLYGRRETLNDLMDYLSYKEEEGE